VVRSASSPFEAKIAICEVGPRDGLQNEATVLSVSDRATLIDRLAGSGLALIEAASFVSPTLVPQMARSEEVLASIDRERGARYAGLALNKRGAERALAAKVDLIRFVVPATDSFSRRNQGMTTRASVAEFAEVAVLAKATGIECAATIAVAFGCPFEGRVPQFKITQLAIELVAAGATEVIIADTIGVAIPDQVTRLFADVRAQVGATPLGGHFHNTRNSGLANCLAAADAGAQILDASVGGIGGCPFAPRATGNVPTEDLIYMLGSRLRGRVDLNALIDTANWLQERLGRPLPGMLMKAGAFPVST
jgi:isopropylmalate/homocitrate/citramalate synthase